MLFELLLSKPMVDCMVLTIERTECNPYGKEFYYTKKIDYTHNKQELIIDKTLPISKKRYPMKNISVSEMIKKSKKVEDATHFSGSFVNPVKNIAIEKPLDKEIVDDIIKKPELQKKENREAEVASKKEKIVKKYGYYVVSDGDVLSKIAKKLGLKVSTLVKLNTLKDKSSLHIHQKLKIPLEQKMIDSLSTGNYIIEKGDTLISIAKKFKLLSKDIAVFNHISDATTIHIGKVLKLPFPYILAQTKRKKKIEVPIQKNRHFDMNRFTNHKLRVTATAYTSHAKQTDSTPFLAAWNNHLFPGRRTIAVSRDLLTQYGMKNGTKVRISGLRGYYWVRDKMNKRYKRRIDIYMGLNRRRALHWGRRSVIIYW